MRKREQNGYSTLITHGNISALTFKICYDCINHTYLSLNCNIVK